MGIKSINEIVKEVSPRSFRLVKPSDFKGTRIAVDGNLWAHANFSVSYNKFVNSPSTDAIEDLPMGPDGRDEVIKIVFERAVSFICDMMAAGITPFFVFDGEAVPEKNSGARKRRAERREYMTSRVEKLRAQLLDTNKLFRKNSDLEALKGLYRQQIPIKPHDITAIKSFIRDVAYAPLIEAPDEAEKFCSYLGANGFVSGVWTTDTDTYAFGAPIVITGMEGALFKVFVNAETLTAFDLSRIQFVDLCIFLGCDFNTPIKGIGPKTAWKLIKAVREENPDSNRLIELASVKASDKYPNRDWGQLNAERCRNIFLGIEGFREILNAIKDNEELCKITRASPNLRVRSSTKIIESHPPKSVKFYSKDGKTKDEVVYFY